MYLNPLKYLHSFFNSSRRIVPLLLSFSIITVVHSRFLFLRFHINSYVVPKSYRWFIEDLPKGGAIYSSILFKGNKLHAKSTCHQLNLMEDKHTINLILISSKWVILSFGVCSWWINSSSKCFHLFFSGVQISSAISSEPPSKSSQGSSYSFFLHSISSSFCYRSSSWWFFMI